jgi:ribosomal protein S1
MSTEIYLVYITLSTGEEIRIDIVDTWEKARKIMRSYKRKGIASRAQLINTTSEETENKSICAPVYFTL